VIDEALLKILRCPKDLSPLSLANPQLLARVNRAIAAGRIVNLEGVGVQRQLKDALVSETGALLYPIINQIPALLPGEAISLSQLDNTNGEKTDA
jgi:uncharacterized protein YbaR (Trm112 family)